MRRAAGDMFMIGVDGHMGGIPEPITAIEGLEVARVLERFGVSFFEEPLSYLDPAGYAWLRQRAGVRIAGGESLALRAGFQSFTDQEALEYPTARFELRRRNRTGHRDRRPCRGVRAERAAALLVRWPLALWPMFTWRWRSSVVERLEMARELTDLQVATLAERPMIRDGVLLAPTAPGLGIDFEPSLAERFAFTPGLAERASMIVVAQLSLEFCRKETETDREYETALLTNEIELNPADAPADLELRFCADEPAAIDAAIDDSIEILVADALPTSLERCAGLRWVQLLSAGINQLIGHPLLARSAADQRRWAPPPCISPSSWSPSCWAISKGCASSTSSSDRTSASRPHRAGAANAARHVRRGGGLWRHQPRDGASAGGVGAADHRGEQRRDALLGAIRRSDGIGDPDGGAARTMVATADLRAVLRRADVVVLALPLLPRRGT